MLIRLDFIILVIGFWAWLLYIVISTRKEVRELRSLLNTHMAELKKSVREK